MTIPDFYEVTFSWPHPEPKVVILTGTFDDWSASTPLIKTPTGFEGTAKIPWGQKIKYKFVVDGEWIIHEDQPTETDPGGFVNNVYTAPPKPAEESAAVAEVIETPANVKDAEPTANGHATNGHGIVAEGVANPESGSTEVPPAEQEAKPAEAGPVANEGKVTPAIPNTVPKQPPTGYPQMLADLASTIVARDGTSSTLEYVASGLGAAMHSMVGVDPINIQKISIPTPKPEDAFMLPGGDESVHNTADLPSDSALSEATEASPAKSLPSPVAPIVPILIVPVNAAENNTAAPSEADTIIPATVSEVAVPAEIVPEVAAAAAAEEVAKVEEPSTHLLPILVADVPAESAAEGTAAPESSAAPGDAPVVESETVPESIVEQPVAEAALHEVAVAPQPIPEVAAEVFEEEPSVVAEEPVIEPAMVIVEEPTTVAAEEPTPEPTVAVAEEPIPELVVVTEDIPPAAVVEEPVEPVVEEPVAPIVEGSTVEEQIAPHKPAEEVKTEEPSTPEPEPIPAPVEVKEEEKTISESTPAPSNVVVVESPALGAVKVAEEVGSEPTPTPAVEEDKAEEVAVLEPTPVEEVIAEVKVEEAVPVLEPTPSPPVVDAPVAEVKAKEPSAPEPEPAAAAEEPSVQAKVANAIVPEATPVLIEAAVASKAVQDEVIPTPAVEDSVAADKPEESTVSEPEVKLESVVEITPKAAKVKDEVVVSVEEKAAKEPATTPAPETAAIASGTSVAEVVHAPATTEQVDVPKDVVPAAVAPTTDALADAKAEMKPATNGTTPPTATASTPATPAKTELKFPSETNESPSSSKMNSVRKKRTSIFGKLKHIFQHDKEKEKEKEKK